MECRPVQRLLDAPSTHHQRQARTGEHTYTHYTTVSAIRTHNETQETLDLTPRSGTIITPVPALIRARL